MTTVNPLFVKLCIPTGLEEVLEGLAREVLRRQPENINSFAAVYFDKLLAIRNEAEKRGSDINLQSLIARGKLLEINEEDLIKISMRDETLINGDEEIIDPDKAKQFGKREISDKMQPKMVAAAAISKPAEIQISEPLDVSINKDDEGTAYTNTEYEEKLGNDLPVGIAVEIGPDEEDDLDKIATNQETEEMEIQEMKSEKSSDNSEMDKEQPEELESELETAMGLQEDQGDEIISPNEDTSLLLKTASETEAEFETLKESMEDLSKLEKTAENLTPSSARALKTEEFQPNEKPVELVDFKLLQSSDQNENTEIEETLEGSSLNGFITSNQVTINDDNSRLIPIETEIKDSANNFVKENDNDQDVKVEIEEIVEGSSSDEYIEENLSLNPIVEEVEDSVRDEDDVNKDETIEVEEITEGRSSSNEFITSTQILEIDEDSTLKPMEAKVEDSEEKPMREDDETKNSAMTVPEASVAQPIECIEANVFNESAEIEENTPVIQEKSADNELAVLSNVMDNQPMMISEEIKSDEEDIEARRETDVETGKERELEATGEVEDGTREETDTDNRQEEVKEEVGEDNQESEAMYTINEKSASAVEIEMTKEPEEQDSIEEQTLLQQNEENSKRDEQPENETDQNEVVVTVEPYLESIANDVFEVQALSQQPEEIRAIQISENLSAEMALKKTVDKIPDNESDENRRTSKNTENDEQTTADYVESACVTEDTLLEDTEKTDEKPSEDEFSGILQTVQQQDETDINELESTAVSSSTEVDRDIESETASFQESNRTQQSNEQPVEIRENTTDEDLSGVNEIEEAADEIKEKASEDELQEISQTIENVNDEEQVEIEIISELLEESTDQNEVQGSIDESQDVLQINQITEPYNQAEIDNQMESTLAMEAGLLEDTADNMDEEQKETEINSKLLEELTDQNEVKESIDEPQEVLQTDQITEIYNQTEIGNQMESILAMEAGLLEDTADNMDEEQKETEINSKLLEELTDQNEVTESIDEPQEVLQTDQITEIYNQAEIGNQMESTLAMEAGLLEDTADNMDEEQIETEINSQLLEELTDQNEVKESIDEPQEVLQTDQITEIYNQAEIGNQMESTLAMEAGSLEDTADNMDEEQIETEINSKLLEELTDQNEVKESIDVPQEVLQTDQITEIYNQAEIGNQMESTLAMEAGLLEDTADNMDEEQIETEINSKLLEESSDQSEVQGSIDEPQEVLQIDQITEPYNQAETDNQMESTLAMEAGLLEDTADNMDEEQIETEINSKLLEESTDQSEVQGSIDEPQEVLQIDQITEPYNLAETDNQMESTLAMEAGLLEDTADNMDEESTAESDVKLLEEANGLFEETKKEDEFQKQLQTTQNAQEQEQSETDSNLLESTISTEIGLREDPADKTDEEIYEALPMSQKPEEIREIKIDEDLCEVIASDEIKDDIEEKTSENERQENVHIVQNINDDEPTENDIDQEESITTTKVKLLEESTDQSEVKALEGEFQEVLQTIQMPCYESQGNADINLMASTGINFNETIGDSNLKIKESEGLADNEDFESTNVQDIGPLANAIEIGVDMEGQITQDELVSANNAEGQEIEGENKSEEERNGNELANTENDDSQTVKVNDTVKTEAPERGDDFIDQMQNADKLETLEGKHGDVQKSDNESLLLNGELEETNAENTHVRTESGEILTAENLDRISNADYVKEGDKSKETQEDETMDISEENSVEFGIAKNQTQTENDVEINVEELYEENRKELQNIAGLKEEEIGDDIQLSSSNEEKQINDVQEIVSLEEIKEEKSTDAETIIDEQEFQKEIAVDVATTEKMQAHDDNLDGVKNDNMNDAVTEENDESATLNPNEILKSEAINAILENELEEKYEEAENERVETTLEGSAEKQMDEPIETKKELEEDVLEIVEENPPLDGILFDASQITNEDINQLEIPNESITDDELEKADEDNQPTIEGNETESIRATEKENQTKEKAETAVDESIIALSTVNEQESIPITDQLQISNPISTMDQTSQSSETATTEKTPLMETLAISSIELSNDETEIETEKENAIAERAKDDSKDDEQLGEQVEIFENIIIPENDQQLTSELVDRLQVENIDEKGKIVETVINQDLLTEFNQPSIALNDSKDEFQKENEDVEVQIPGNVNDENLEIENNFTMDRDSLEFENKRTEDVLGVKDEAPEFDSLEYNQLIEEKSNQPEGEQDLDSLEINKTIEDYSKAISEVQELNSSSEVQDNYTNEENPEIDSENIGMVRYEEAINDDDNVRTIAIESIMDNIREVPPTSENELKADVIAENSGVEVENKDNIIQSTEKPEDSEDSRKVANITSIQKTITDTMAEINESMELTIESDIGEPEVIQRVSNEATSLTDFEQVADEKVDQDSMEFAGKEPSNNNLVNETGESEGILLNEKTFESSEENNDTVVQLSTEEVNFNDEKQLENSNEPLIAINEPELEVPEQNNDNVLSNSEEINMDEAGKYDETSEKISLEMNEDSTVQASEFIKPGLAQINNEEITDITSSENQEDAPGLVNDDTSAISEEILMKEIAEDLQSNRQDNLESTSAMQVADLVNSPTYPEAEVNEPEIIKEIEQLDEPNFTELYNKLESNNDASSNGNQENENMSLDSQELENTNVSEEMSSDRMNECITGPNETNDSIKAFEENGNGLENNDEVNEQAVSIPDQLANGNSYKDTDEDFSKQKELEESNLVEAFETLEKSEETVNFNEPEIKMPVNEEFVSEEEIKQKYTVESLSNALEENQIGDEQLNIAQPVETLILLNKYNQDDDEEIGLDPAQSAQETEEKMQNQEENSQNVSIQPAEILTGKDVETNFQENIDNNSEILANEPISSTEKVPVNDEEDAVGNNVDQMSEKDGSYNDNSIEAAEINETENITSEPHDISGTITLETNQNQNKITEFETDDTAEATPTSEETTENKRMEFNGGTLIEKIVSVQIPEQMDISNSNTTTDDSLAESGQEINSSINTVNNSELLVDDNNAKTNAIDNIEMLSLSKEADEVEVLEPTIERNDISESESAQYPEEIQMNNIPKNENDDNELLALDEQNEANAEMSGETPLPEQDDNLKKFKNLPEAKAEDELAISATAQSLQKEQSSEFESTDVKNTLATRIEDSEAPILPPVEDKLEEQRQEESKPENPSQEESGVAEDEQGLENTQGKMTNYEQLEVTAEEILQENPVNQPDAGNDIGDDDIKAFLDGQTNESITLTEVETGEVRREFLNNQGIRDITEIVSVDEISKPIPEEQRKSKEQDKNDVKRKEKAKEESNVNGFEILGQSIVLKPKRFHERTDANHGQSEQAIATEQETDAKSDFGQKQFPNVNDNYFEKTEHLVSNSDDKPEIIALDVPNASTDDDQIVSKLTSEGQTYVNDRTAPEIAVEASKQYDVNDDFKETSKGTIDFINTEVGEQDQLDTKNTINEGDDPDEDNDVMIGQGLTSPPEEPSSAISSLVP